LNRSSKPDGGWKLVHHLLMSTSGHQNDQQAKPQVSKFTEQLLERCDKLAKLSSMTDAICRVYLSAEHQAANTAVLDWMRDAGMASYVDAVGNVRGRYAGASEQAPVLVIGSHLDSVPDAGAYDGILGVLLGISAVAELHAAGRRLPFAIEVIGFGEEEGVRFGTTLMTSRAVAGTWQEDWWQLTDAEGVSVREAFEQFQLNPSQLPEAILNPAEVLAYVEVHIEQGPVLEAENLPLGVVTAIAGAKRMRVGIRGLAGHAGTTPMNLRRDALVAAARGIALIEQEAQRFDVVATVGQIHCEPGGVNVIPGYAEFSLDIRSGDDATRDKALAEIVAALQQDCAARNLQLDIEETHSATAAPCAVHLQSLFAEALAACDVPVHSLASGAGHDAMAMAELCDVAMLFVRSPGGISHNPAESVIPTDVALAQQVLLEFLIKLAGVHSDRDSNTDRSLENG